MSIRSVDVRTGTDRLDNQFHHTDTDKLSRWLNRDQLRTIVQSSGDLESARHLLRSANALVERDVYGNNSCRLNCEDDHESVVACRRQTTTNSHCSAVPISRESLKNKSTSMIGYEVKLERKDVGVSSITLEIGSASFAETRYWCLSVSGWIKWTVEEQERRVNHGRQVNEWLTTLVAIVSKQETTDPSLLKVIKTIFCFSLIGCLLLIAFCFLGRPSKPLKSSFRLTRMVVRSSETASTAILDDPDNRTICLVTLSCLPPK